MSTIGLMRASNKVIFNWRPFKMNLSSVSNFDETQTNYCLRALQLTADPESLSEYVGAKYPALSLSLLSCSTIDDFPLFSTGIKGWGYLQYAAKPANLAWYVKWRWMVYMRGHSLCTRIIWKGIRYSITVQKTRKYKVRCPNFQQSLIPNTSSSWSLVTAVVLINLISKLEV